MLFLIFYFGGIVIVAEAVNAVSARWPEEGKCVVILPDVKIIFPSREGAEDYVEMMGCKIFDIAKLEDLQKGKGESNEGT